MTDERRPYEKKRRAELEAETRLRITESAMELHGTVGPARTSISAVADRAGVRRSTVYRHFPDEAALFTACSSHWAAENPVPDIERLAVDRRIRTSACAPALDELYAFYRRTEPMMDNLLRDELTVPVVKRLFAPFRDYLAAARETLVRGRPVRGRRRDTTRAAIGHALAYPTWRSLDPRAGPGRRAGGSADVRAGGAARRTAEGAAYAPRMPLLQAALDGDREHPAVPRTPDELASEARASVDAGARVLHLHPYDADGRQDLSRPSPVRPRSERCAPSAAGIPISAEHLRGDRGRPGAAASAGRRMDRACRSS